MAVMLRGDGDGDSWCTRQYRGCGAAVGGRVGDGGGFACVCESFGSCATRALLSHGRRTGMAWDRGAVLGRCSVALRCISGCWDKGRSVDSFRSSCFEDVGVCFGLALLGRVSEIDLCPLRWRF
jgi:hypothetical protein